MGSLGLFTPDLEDRLFTLLYHDGLSPSQAKKRLESEGHLISRRQLDDFTARSFEIMREKGKRELVSNYLMDSFPKVKEQFEIINEKTMEMLESPEESTRLAAIKELREQHVIVLKKLNELDTITHSVTNNTLITDSNFINAIRENQLKWFSDSNAKMENGKIILTNPSPEMVENFKKWEESRSRDYFINSKEVEA